MSTAPIRYRCGQCKQPMPNLGRVLRRVDGVKTWVGRCCAKAPKP